MTSITEKRCVICKETKPLEEFNRNRSHPTGRQARCRPCDQERARANYSKGLYNAKIREGRARRGQLKREWIWNYLIEHPCVDCGEIDPVVLEFDHVRGVKANHVSHMVASTDTMTKLQEEVAKCDVRCANCHRRKTAKDLGWFAG